MTGPGLRVQATPEELRMKGRLGYQTVEPTVMSYLIIWVLLWMALIFAFVGVDRDIPQWFDPLFVVYVGVFAVFALVANFCNRIYLRVDGAGIVSSVWPIPVNGFRWRRWLARESIAGIYVSQCDLFVRSWIRLRRSYEVHALTTSGEPVCLWYRIRTAAEAADLAVEIRKRLRLSETLVPLRGGVRSQSDKSLQVAGRFPAWVFWLALMLLGLLPVLGPVLSVAGWTQATAKVVQTGGLHEGRRECSVRFVALGAEVSRQVENRCDWNVNRGERITVYYDPGNAKTVRILSLQLWPLGLIPFLIGAAGLYFVRERPEFPAGRRVLWRERFRYVNVFWNLRMKDTAAVRKGVLTVQRLERSQAIANTDRAFNPGVLEMSIQPGDQNGPDDAAGILFDVSYDGIGYVFGIFPRRQVAFARRVGPDWSYQQMPYADVKEICAEAGAWNRLRVEIDRGRAEFFVNGVRAGSMEYNATLGGGMVGIYGDFGEGKVWRYRDLVVLA